MGGGGICINNLKQFAKYESKTYLFGSRNRNPKSAVFIWRIATPNSSKI